jgi:spore germination cell wall hydrolase CwlJ-like protein
MNHKFLLGMSKQAVVRLLVKASLFALTLVVFVNAVAGPLGKNNSAYDKSMTPVTEWISDQLHSYENESWEQRLRRLMRSNLEEVGGTKKAVVDKQVRCLAENIYFESRGESLAGQVAVAKVTLNRLNEGYARTVCGVVKQGCQFSWVCNNPKAVPTGQTWTQAVGIALVMLSDKDHIEDPTNGATHFHATYINWQPSWKRVKSSVSQIGNHVFYRIKPKEEK